MKRIAIAFALALSPLAAAGACATYEQVAKSPRAILADAETAWIGAAEIARLMYANQLISPGQFQMTYSLLAETSAKLDDAHTLLKAGEAILAVGKANDVFAALSELSHKLALIRDEHKAKAQPAPVAPEPTPARFRATEI